MPKSAPARTKSATPLPPAPPTPPARGAGVLLHVTSLPGPYGIGDFGPTAHAFVDTLADAGQTLWQILPLNPPGEGDSPYNAYSAFALNPNLISPDALVQAGLLDRPDLPTATFRPDRVDYKKARALKAGLLARAFANFQGGAAKPLRRDFDKFRADAAAWLDDFALFMALKDAHPPCHWTDWPRDLVLRRPAAVAAARRDHADAVAFHQFAQFLADRQARALRAHANARGVRLVGDLPIFVSGDSADVWAAPHLFRLDKDRRQTVVAGVPPDYFSATGQRWGNPHYDWRAMAKDDFAWWTARARAVLRHVDLVRIDHFRGFAACWEIPAHLPTAQKGRWAPAPGHALFTAMRQQLGHLPFIAEDLGLITPDVETLRADFHLPGMKVLQFAFDGDPNNPFLPHNHTPNSVVYTGTHDNDTTVGWFRTQPPKTRKYLTTYATGHTRNGQAADTPAWTLIRLALASPSRHAIVPVQDLLSLPSAARMNTPGLATNNWRWRLPPDHLTPQHLDRLKALTQTYGRHPS